MQVGDLDFQLSVSGTRAVKEEIDDVISKVKELAGVAEALDGKDVDIDLDADNAVTELQGVSRSIEALDGREINVETDVEDVDASALAAGTITRGGGGGAASVSRSGDNTVLGAFQQQSLSENLSRLNDEAFAVASIFTGLTATTKALVGGLGSFAVVIGGTVAAVGGLAAAATGLAANFGDIEIRSEVSKLKGAFQEVGRRFVESFEPLIREQIIPGGLAFATALRDAVPQLKRITSTWLPSLIEAIVALVDDLVKFTSDVAGIAGLFIDLKEVVEGFISFLALLISNLADSISNAAGVGDIVKDVNRDAQRRNIGEALVAVGALERDQSEQDATLQRIEDLIDEFRNREEGPILGGLKKFEDIRKEIKGIQRLTEETTESGEPLRTEAEAIKGQFRLAQKAVEGLAKKGLTDTKQFRDFKSLLADIRKRAEEAGVELEAVQGATAPPRPETPRPFVTPDSEAVIPETSFGGLFEGAGVGAIQEALDAGLIQSVSGAEDALSSLREQFNNATSASQREKIQAVIDEVKNLRNAFTGASQEAASLGQALTQQGIQALQQLTQGIGSEIGGALFADQGRLDRLRSRRRSIQQNLRQARQSGNFQQVQQLRQELTRVNKKLNQTQSLFGRLGQAVKGFGQVFQQVLQQVIAKLTSAALLSLALAPFTGGLSSFGGNFTTILGGGIPNLQGAATGGFVEAGGLAQIHKGEAIVSKKMLDSGFDTQGTAGTLSTGSPTIEGGAIRIPVEMVDQAQKRGNTNRKRTGRKA